MIGAFNNGRTRLRAIEPADWEAFAKWEADSERSSWQYFTPWPASEGAWRQWTEEQSGTNPKEGDDTCRLVIATDTGHPVGQLTVWAANRMNGRFTYGIGIGREHGGRGHAREALEMLLAYYFLELRYAKCEVTVDATNEPSLRLHEGLGFRREGVMRSAYFWRGTRTDEIWLGMTFDEYVALR